MAFAVRAGATILVGENQRLYYEYMTIADNLLHGFGYSFDEWGRAPLQPTSFLPPLYVYWCAFWMWIFPDNFVPMYLGQAAIAASGCLPAYWVGRGMFGEQTGRLFAIAYAIYPELVYLHTRPVSEFLYVVLALWLLYLYCELSTKETDNREKTAIRLFIVGFVGGIAVLIKEATTVLLAAILAALFLKRRQIPLAYWRVVGITAAGLFAVLAPWIVRNYVVQGEFIPIRTGYGITSWLANHPGATGTDKALDGRYILDTMDRDYRAAIDARLPEDEQARDRVYISETRRFISEHPTEYLRLCIKRLQYFLWFDETHPIARSSMYRLSYIFLLLIAIPGVIWAIRRHRLDPILPLIGIGYVMLYVPVLVLPRYRIILVVLFLLMAAYTICTFREGWKRRYRNPTQY